MSWPPLLQSWAITQLWIFIAARVIGAVLATGVYTAIRVRPAEVIPTRLAERLWRPSKLKERGKGAKAPSMQATVMFPTQNKSGCAAEQTRQAIGFQLCRVWALLFVVTVFALWCPAQNSPTAADAKEQSKGRQLSVNWLYGAYVPSDVPVKPLTNDERRRLYVRQTFTTPGIYIKTVFFSAHDHIVNNPPEWDGGIAGYGKRVLSRHTQFVIQNSLSAAGNAIVGWEPRYDRCRCTGFWPRTRHAVARNFVTYGRTGKNLRPQLMPYAAAFGSGAIAAFWQPSRANPTVKGYQNAITQIGVGIGLNWVGEFAPELFRVLRRKNKNSD